jgi:L-seryl-tRNA(Ser) seleniumtransferase
LSRDKNVPLLEDQGSGCIIDMKRLGLEEEPSPKTSLSLGVPMVCFSGDKMLGGPQAGIIAGKSEWIVQLRRNPLFRALRVDKLTLTLLESTLISYLKQREFAEVPVVRMMHWKPEELENRATSILRRLPLEKTGCEIQYIDGFSMIGGGSAPDARLPTKLIAIRHSAVSSRQLDEQLRQADPPVVARVEDDWLLLDLRTVFPQEDDELVKILKTLLCETARS